MGEVRVCIQCYWGQDPVHVSNMRRDSDQSSTESHAENELDYYFSDHELGSLECATPRSSQSVKLKLIIPVPAFVLDTMRKLSFKELGRMNVQNFATRKVYVNICVHSCVPIITHGGEYFISDDVAVVQRADRDPQNKYSSMQADRRETSGKEDSVEYEVYHVLVDPNSLRASLSNDPQNMERTDQLMMRIIRNLAIKFQLGLSKRFDQLSDCVYMGGTVTSMYVPYTGSELEDDDDLGDKRFSCDNEACSDDESDVTSGRPSEQSEALLEVRLSAELEEWERKVAADQAAQQAVSAAVEQHIQQVPSEDREEWERKLVQERNEQTEDRPKLLRLNDWPDSNLPKSSVSRSSVKSSSRSKSEIVRRKEARRVAAAKKAEAESKAAAEKIAIDRRNAETAAAAVLLAKQTADREQAEKESKKVADQNEKDRVERERAAEKAAAVAAAEAKRTQDKLDKEVKASAARAAKQQADLDARAETDRVAKEKKDAETVAANERAAKEAKSVAEREAKEKLDLEAQKQAEFEARSAAEASSRAASEKEARDREQKEGAARQRGEEEATAAAALAVSVEKERAAQQTQQAAVEEEKKTREEADSFAARVAAAKRASQSIKPSSNSTSSSNLQLSELDTTASEPLIVVQIPEINVTPTAWCVIKTKTADMTKCFVNVGFHGALPNITETTYDTTAHEEYLNANFVQFTLNKKRCVMFVGSLRDTADKDGSNCTLCDVTISMSAYNSCTKDETLVDKLFIKILKALKKRHGVDLDADYKLPKILKNYKGAETLSVNVPAFRSNTATKLSARGANSDRSLSSDLATGVNPMATPTVFGSNPMSSPMKGPATSSATTPTNSGRSSISAGSSSGAVSPKRTSIVNPEWNQKWGKFAPGKNVVYTSQIGKKNAMGITIVRQLLLTDEPSLLYVDAVSMTHKGDIEWLRGSPPKATFIDKSNFEIAVAKRVYKFNDRENNAAMWVRKINEVAANAV
eukprot:gene22334-28453_t